MLHFSSGYGHGGGFTAIQAVPGAVGVPKSQAQAMEDDDVAVCRGNTHTGGEGKLAYHCLVGGAFRHTQQAEPDFSRLGASVCLFHP